MPQLKGTGDQERCESHRIPQVAPDPSHRKGLGIYRAGRAEGKLNGPCEGILHKLEVPPCQQGLPRNGPSRDKSEARDPVHCG